MNASRARPRGRRFEPRLDGPLTGRLGQTWRPVGGAMSNDMGEGWWRRAPGDGGRRAMLGTAGGALMATGAAQGEGAVGAGSLEQAFRGNHGGRAKRMIRHGLGARRRMIGSSCHWMGRWRRVRHRTATGGHASSGHVAPRPPTQPGRSCFSNGLGKIGITPRHAGESCGAVAFPRNATGGPRGARVRGPRKADGRRRTGAAAAAPAAGCRCDKRSETPFACAATWGRAHAGALRTGCAPPLAPTRTAAALGKWC
jgi:hypothetical protein